MPERIREKETSDDGSLIAIQALQQDRQTCPVPLQDIQHAYAHAALTGVAMTMSMPRLLKVLKC
jgi:hypothetical protein